jgi:hypothetical protein
MRSRIVIALLIFANSLFSADLFDYHSGLWLNLHHFLYQLAVNAKESKPVAGAGLTGDAGAAWSAAIQYYGASVINKNLLFDDDLTAVKTNLAALEKADSLRDSALPPTLVEVLEKAAPVYRANWWQRHNDANRVWIAALEPLVAEHGAQFLPRLRVSTTRRGRPRRFASTSSPGVARMALTPRCARTKSLSTRPMLSTAAWRRWR